MLLTLSDGLITLPPRRCPERDQSALLCSAWTAALLGMLSSGCGRVDTETVVRDVGTRRALIEEYALLERPSPSASRATALE